MLDVVGSFGDAVWHGAPDVPKRRSSTALAQQTFIRGMLEMPTQEDHRNPLDLAASLLLHILIVAVLVIAPLLFTRTIDFSKFDETFLVAPRPPAAAPPPAPAEKVIKAAPRPIPQQSVTQPIAIPARIQVVHDAAPPDLGASAVVGGVPGGIPGGALGGIIGGAENVPPPPLPAATHPTKEIFRVGGDVKEPMAIYAPPPAYPALARASRLEGTVIIDAVIDENGRVVEA
ncbi:MAG: energy transducer TonB, partial [Acidobacteriota bacterium]|nr:energy transducer TonB [Acidobacteriota bacterium]